MKYPILYSFKRCPYAMRARMALQLTNIKCEIREVRLNKLKNKPCKTLDELVEKSNIIITCLPSPKSVNNVIETLLKYLTKNVCL